VSAKSSMMAGLKSVALLRQLQSANEKLSAEQLILLV
jgi:hypothetical protein